MKITLQQNEIEQAIRAHIATTISLPEGAEIDLEEEDGDFTAIIDLNPSEQKSTEAKAKRTYQRRPKAETALVTGGTAMGTGAAASAEPTSSPAATEPAQQAADEAKSIETLKDTPEVVDPAPEQAAADPAPAVEPRPSLFGGLKRPSNG